jgi:hypothetical protein
MNNFDHLQHLLATRLGGEPSRWPELFRDDTLFLQLQSSGQASDWHRFQAGSLDGVYLVREGEQYAVYAQERGAPSDRQAFASLDAAAGAFFRRYW